MPSPKPASPLDLVLRHAGGTIRCRLDRPLVIGRDNDADVAVPDPDVSRRHCSVEVVPGGIKVRDLGSSNGTHVRGQDISQVLVPIGATVHLGKGEVSFTTVPAGSTETISDQPPGDHSPHAKPPAVTSKAASAPPPAVPIDRPMTKDRSAPAPRKTRALRPLIGVSVLVLAAIGIIVATRTTDEDRAQASFRVAQNLRVARKLEGARAELESLVAQWPNTASAERAREDMAALEKTLAARTAALEEIRGVANDPEIVTSAERLDMMRSIHARLEPGTLTDVEIAEGLGLAEEFSERRSRAVVADARTAVLTHLAIGHYGMAWNVVLSAKESPHLLSAQELELTALQQRIEGEAKVGFGTWISKLNNVAPETQLGYLSEALTHFAGSPYEGELRARSEVLKAELARAKSAVASGKTPAAEPTRAPLASDAVMVALKKAEECVGARRYGAALPHYEQVITHAPAMDRTRFTQRRDRIQLLATFVDSLSARVRAEPLAFKGLDVLPGTKGDVVQVTREHVEVALGKTARMRWDWARLDAERAMTLIVRSGLKGEAGVAAAAFLLELGDRKNATVVLGERFIREPELRSKLTPLVAELRGLTVVPQSGFHFLDGAFLTSEEHTLALRQKHLASLGTKLKESKGEEWLQALSELKGLGEEGEVTAKAALRERLGRLATAIQSLDGLKGPALHDLRTKLHAELALSRTEALALIYDAKRYPYPYAENQDQIQSEVDGLVQKVRALWETPARHSLAKVDGLDGLLSEGRLVIQAAHDLGDTEVQEASLTQAVDRALDLSQFAPDEKIRDVLSHAQEVAAYNDTITEMSEDERECHRVTNAYRLMMGLRALMSDERLVRCARGHSQEMKDLGYFSHTSPTSGREGPSQRAKLAGYGSGVSENIAAGQSTGAAVVASWCHSSGHHRNILGRGHTHLGVGKSVGGSIWTQNFGSGSTSPPKPTGEKKKPGPDRRGGDDGGPKRGG